MQVLSTKLSIPPIRPRLVARSRLSQKLNQGAECGFVLVSAPAGYGKSTLLSAWLSQTKYATTWLSLDDGDNDPLRFLIYLAAALGKIEPALGEALENTLQVSSLPAVDILLTPLVNLLATFERPFWLVLDDYHLIHNQVVHQMISFLLEQHPASLHLAIATRADPPLHLSRLRAHSKMVELRLADLRFTIPEISEFLCDGMGLVLSQADLALLEASTEGWVAGLQMAGLSLQGKADPSSFIRSFSGEDRYILDFLFDEVFQKQSVRIQNFLLQTAILERFCASLCNAVTLREDSQNILDSLERSNLFLISIDEKRKWYRYHHLFADLLKSRLKLTIPGAGTLLHQRASSWYEAEHDLENAISHALVGQDFERAACLIEKIVQNLDKQNKQATLTSWVDQLPREILEDHPWLCVYRAWGYYWTGRRQMEEEWLQTAEKNIERTFEEGSKERQHIQGHIAAVRAHVAIVAEDISRVLEMAQRALDLLPEDDEMRCETAIALGAAYWGRGDVRLSEQAFKMAQTAVLKLKYPIMVAGPTCYAGLQQVKQGRLQDALVTFHEGLRLATLPDGSETPIAGFPNVKIGDVWREQNNLTLASHYLTRGLEQCVQFSQPDVLAEAYICLGRYKLAVGDLDGTHEALRKVDRVAEQIKLDPFVLTWLDECRLKAWLVEKNLDAAVQWARNCGLSVDGPFNYLHDLPHQNLARVWVAQGLMTGAKIPHEQAVALLDRLRVAAGQAGWVHEEIKVLVLQAMNFEAIPNHDMALQCLARAITLAEPGGYVRVFLDEGEFLHGLLASLAYTLRNNEQDTLRMRIADSEDHWDRLKRALSHLMLAFDKRPARIQPNETIPALSAQAQNASLVQRNPSQAIVEPLSSREFEVLKLLAQGCPDKNIAAALFIASETVHKHLKNIYGKLEVHSRTEAIARARELGLL